MSIDPSFMSSFALVLTCFGGAFLAALWVSLVVWTYRDIRDRARDPLVHAGTIDRDICRCRLH
mgnify:CR=1 FL=1